MEAHSNLLAWLYSRIIDIDAKSGFLHWDMFNGLITSNQIDFEILVQETWNKTWVTRLKKLTHTHLKLERALHITTLRDPVDAFESLFHHLELAQFYNVSSFAEFVLKCNSTECPGRGRKHGLWGRNQLSYSLGLEEKYFDDMKMIEQFSKEIEEQFDLVMIAEYFEESLIVLKNMLNVPLIHVISAKVNARHNDSKHVVTTQERSILSNWLKADIHLYQLFRR
ncbi:hypothetical protein QYM36_019286 [Artemia franciscana]|uniref:Uncharacterized protein n=1 Tax=Artemia franciscana TaxID=6661 RepID=A0AA88KTI6_ARTSF|nr:hypothetical protein QYM36_019286 [Artemia franciscana]